MKLRLSAAVAASVRSSQWKYSNTGYVLLGAIVRKRRVEHVTRVVLGSEAVEVYPQKQAPGRHQ